MTNGLIDLADLIRVQPGLYLTPLAAESWLVIVAGVREQFGWTPHLTDAYRTYAKQVEIFTDRYVRQATGGGYYGDVRWWNGVRYVRRAGTAAAAVPGTSNHGTATAVDVADLGSFGSARFNEFASVATRNGWSIAEGRSVGEPWHWTKNSASYANNPVQSVGGVPTVPDIAPIEPLEDDMPLNQDDQDIIFRLVSDLTKKAIDERLDGQTPILNNQADQETIDRLIIGRTAQALAPIAANVAALLETVQRLAVGQGIDPAAIQAAAEAGARAALKGLTLTAKTA
jgi:hypothetical protein